MRIIAALILVLIAAPAWGHSSRACVNSSACKAEVAAAVAAANAKSAETIAALQREIAVLKASIPCQIFVATAAEADAVVGLDAVSCLVVNSVTKCDDKYCAEWLAP